MRQVWNGKRLFQLLWPLVIENILAMAMGFVDTIMMSRVGEYAISGVSLVDSISVLLIITFMALATGGSVVVSQYIGRRDQEHASAAAKQLIYTVMLVALVISAFTLCFSTGLLRLIYGRIDPDVMEAAKKYFFISSLGYPALGLYNASAALFRAQGNSRVTMLVSVLINVVHVGLNFLFIYGFNMGVAGAATSTLVSRVVGGGALMFLLMKNRGVVRLTGILKVRFDIRLIRVILKIGIPSGVESGIFQFGKILVARVPTTFGTAAVAANAITNTLNGMSNMPANAFNTALVTIVGQCIGASAFADAKFFARRFMLYVYAAISLTSASILIFLDPLVGIFNLSPEAHEMAKNFVTVLCVVNFFAYPPSWTMPNALRASGDASYVMIVAVVSMWVVRVVGAYFMCYSWTLPIGGMEITIGLGLGIMGIWYGMVGDWCVRGVFFLTRWRSGRWMSKKVI
jgi:putative MATE family efflux protein